VALVVFGGGAVRVDALVLRGEREIENPSGHERLNLTSLAPVARFNNAYGTGRSPSLQVTAHMSVALH
jgi:hypothetical protein